MLNKTPVFILVSDYSVLLAVTNVWKEPYVCFAFFYCLYLNENYDSENSVLS